MATFGNASDTLIEFKTFENNGSEPQGIKYTVPNGRYAQVFFIFGATSGGGDNLQIIYNFAGLNTIQTAAEQQTFDNGYLLNEGDQIDHNDAFAYYFIVKEYKKP